MLQVVNVEKSYGERTLFRELSFALTPRERLALVGRNGSGKSTLLRMILGEEAPDTGSITFPKDYRVGHLSQHLHFTMPTVRSEVCRGLPPERSDEEYKADIILSGLGFSEHELDRPPGEFSGGFQIRIELARVLLSEPQLLLLDEPTNYLDIVSARWLERFLRQWPGEIIMISHDRSFLDSVSTHTMIIHRGKARRVSGGTQKLYDLIREEEVVYEQTRLNQEKKRKEAEQFIAKFKAKAGTASLAQSRMKMLAKMEIGEELADIPELDFNFTALPFPGKTLLEAERLSFAFPPKDETGTPFQILEDFSLVVKPGDRIGVIGKNGRGKSTLLRVLVGELTPQHGALRSSPHTRTGYFGQTNIQRLTGRLTVEEEIGSSNHQLSRTRIRSIAGTMMFTGDDALKRIEVLSGGERSRVLLGKLIAQPSNLLLLDEPTNHLDLESINALVESLEIYDGAVLLVTHDEFMLRALATRLVIFSERGVEVLEGTYEDFLARGGWGDAEDDPAPSVTKTATTKSPAKKQLADGANGSNDDRKRRAKEREQRRSILGPVEQEIKAVEQRITRFEDKIKQGEGVMAAESAKGGSPDVFKLAELSREVQDARRSIDTLFEQLEALELKKRAYERELGESE